MIHWKNLSTAIICITVLELAAIFNGFNGILLTTVIAIIAGLVGYRIPYGGKNAA